MTDMTPVNVTALQDEVTALRLQLTQANAKLAAVFPPALPPPKTQTVIPVLSEGLKQAVADGCASVTERNLRKALLQIKDFVTYTPARHSQGEVILSMVNQAL